MQAFMHALISVEKKTLKKFNMDLSRFLYKYRINYKILFVS